MNKNLVDQNKCIQCKLCIEVCPVNMLGVDESGQVNFIAERESLCIECGQCMAVCSTDAVKIGKYTYAENFYRLPKDQADAQSFMDLLATRRSVRNYRSKSVSQELIQQALDSLDYAPYGAEPDKVHITVIHDRQIIEQALPPMEAFLDDIVKWIENPIASFMIKRKKGLELFNTIKNHLYPMAKLENYKLKYGDRITRGAPAMIIFHADPGAEEHTNNAMIYATYVMLALHALKLGAAMNGIVSAAINKLPEVKELFQIPESDEAVIALILGHPKYKYTKAVQRGGKTVHWVASSLT